MLERKNTRFIQNRKLKMVPVRLILTLDIADDLYHRLYVHGNVINEDVWKMALSGFRDRQDSTFSFTLRFIKPKLKDELV